MSASGQEFLGCSQDVFHRNTIQETPFCTRENWQSSVLLLTQELDHLGFASPCSNDDTGQGNLDVIALVNIAWDLVGSYKRCLKTITDLEAQMQRLHCDVEQFHNVSAKQRDLIESKNRLVWDLSEKERQANVKLLQEREKLKTVKDELKRLSSTLSQRDSQWSHDIKRRDAELSKLKERLMRLLTDKSTRAVGGGNCGGSNGNLSSGGGNGSSCGSLIESSGIEMSYFLDKPEGKSRARWRNDSGDNRTVFQETVVKDYEARLTVLQKENVETRKLLFSHVFQLATILKEDPDEAAVTMLPLEVSQDSIETLSDNLLEAVEQMMAIKTKAVKMSRAVQEYEERLLKSPELEEDKNDNSSVLRELKAMFDDGKELLRVNHKVLEDEKREVAKMRQDLQHERRELNRLRKQVLGDEFLGAAGQTWNVDAGPSWCQGHTNFTISSNHNGDAGEEEMATAPYQINGCLAASGRPGRHGSSRPPSRPGSKPGSRSHSIAREAKCKSPGGAFISGPCGSNPGTLRRRGGPIAASEARKKQRPRSANISPQRLLSHSIMPQMEGALIVGGGGEPSESAHQKQGQSRGKGSKTKPRTGSVSPSATIGRYSMVSPGSTNTKSLPRHYAGAHSLKLSLPPSAAISGHSGGESSDSVSRPPSSQHAVVKRRPRNPSWTMASNSPIDHLSDCVGDPLQMPAATTSASTTAASSPAGREGRVGPAAAIGEQEEGGSRPGEEDSGCYMDELTAQLDRLGAYIQRREMEEVAAARNNGSATPTAGNNNNGSYTSESEMEEHLQGIRRALARQKRRSKTDQDLEPELEI